MITLAQRVKTDSRIFLRVGRLDAAQWRAEEVVALEDDPVVTHPLERLEVRQHRERYAWLTEQSVVAGLRCTLFATTPAGKVIAYNTVAHKLAVAAFHINYFSVPRAT